MYIQCVQQPPKLPWSVSRRLKEKPSSLWGELSLHLLQTLHRRAHCSWCHQQLCTAGFATDSQIPVSSPASAITSPPTQARWKHWHSAQTQAAAMQGRLSKLLPHGESSPILFSGRDKFFRSWTLMTLVNLSQLRIFCDSVISDYSLLTRSESNFSLS